MENEGVSCGSKKNHGFGRNVNYIIAKCMFTRIAVEVRRKKAVIFDRISFKEGRFIR